MDMSVSMPVCTLWHLTGYSRVMLVRIVTLLYMMGSLGHWYVNRRSRGLRASTWGSVLDAFLG